MDLKEIMEQKSFAVLGDTLNEKKTAYEIKEKMTENGYRVYPVGKELASINDIAEDIDIIDLCIHPAKGLPLMKECKKSFKAVVVQPGAGDEELFDYLKAEHIPYIEGCLLLGLSMFKKVNLCE
ncbi:MAG: CoA-binding protein [Anaerovoracaceae bacterium]|jgi:predicted CoA-binding protein|nr:CoA-binding protein [Anaerovoracaceae bacterium]